MSRWLQITSAIVLLLVCSVYSTSPARAQGGDYCMVPVCTNLASFTPTVFLVPSASAFSVSGTFTLAQGGIFNPSTDAATVELGTFQRFVGIVGVSITIPAGSFQQIGGTFAFSGMVNGASVLGVIFPLGGPNSYAFQIGAAGVPNLPILNPITVGLRVGSQAGIASVSPIFVNPSNE